VIHITLGGRIDMDPAEDPLRRMHRGWVQGMSDDDCYRSNRGRWVLGERADHERYALFSARHEGRKLVRMAIEITAPAEDTGDGRRALRGAILRPGHPVYDAYVGREAPVMTQRNPVAYIGSPLDGQMSCACGCGELIPLQRDFLPGHDQRAIHDRVAKAGGVRKFMEWFDKTWAR
jgi:hypothetical protein